MAPPMRSKHAIMKKRVSQIDVFFKNTYLFLTQNIAKIGVFGAASLRNNMLKKISILFIKGQSAFRNNILKKISILSTKVKIVKKCPPEIICQKNKYFISERVKVPSEIIC